jgi:hypothetical protein
MNIQLVFTIKDPGAAPAVVSGTNLAAMAV